MDRQKRGSVCSARRALRSARRGATLLRTAGITGLFILTSAAIAWGQEIVPAERLSAAAEPPFSALNAALEETADGILATAGQTGATSLKAAIASSPGLAIRHRELPPSAMGAATSRIARLRPELDPILREVGIPTEFAAVVLVESGGNPMARSPKGARGIWQLMPATARRYGLTVSDTEDDRTDVEKSTRAAARYLRDLHLEFRSWRLALAAYNTGEEHLQTAIDRGRSTDFTVLSSLGLLPAETRNYVPAVFAAERQLTNSPAVARDAVPWDRDAQTVFAVATGTRLTP